MGKTPKYVKSAVDNYRNKFDIVQARLNKGTSARMEALGIQKSDFINSLVSSELDKLEKTEGKKFESNQTEKYLRFMDWLDYVEERYGYKEVAEVKSQEERAILEADAEEAGVLEMLRHVWEHPEEYDPDRAIHLQLNADLFPLSKIIVDDDAEHE